MSCEYYPCHNLEKMSCTWCYCPFYFYCSTLNPEELHWLQHEVGIGGYWLDRSHVGKPSVFACEKCTFPHRPEVTEFIKFEMTKVVAETFKRFISNERRNSEED